MRTIHLSRAAMEPWLILPQSLAVINEVVSRYLAGEKLSAEEIQERIHGSTRPEERISGKIAVLPIFGTIFPRANLFSEVSGATSAEIVGKRFTELVNDPAIGAIILDVDSPGGQLPGIEELATKIFEARGTKPIIAIANHLMASAAYWIGTAADEVVVTPSGMVGSIGAYTIHDDISRQLEQDGVKKTIISEGKYKAEASPFMPLTDEARAAIQERVTEAYNLFVEAVARNRGVAVEAVRDGFGEGRTVSARQALRLGMADRVETLEETVERLQKAGGKPMVKSTASYMGNADVPGAATTSDAAQPAAETSDMETLRNYVEVFGPKKGGK